MYPIMNEIKDGLKHAWNTADNLAAIKKLQDHAVELRNTPDCHAGLADIQKSVVACSRTCSEECNAEFTSKAGETLAVAEALGMVGYINLATTYVKECEPSLRGMLMQHTVKKLHDDLGTLATSAGGRVRFSGLWEAVDAMQATRAQRTKDASKKMVGLEFLWTKGQVSAAMMALGGAHAACPGDEGRVLSALESIAEDCRNLVQDSGNKNVAYLGKVEEVHDVANTFLGLISAQPVSAHGTEAMKYRGELVCMRWGAKLRMATKDAQEKLSGPMPHLHANKAFLELQELVSKPDAPVEDAGATDAFKTFEADAHKSCEMVSEHVSKLFAELHAEHDRLYFILKREVVRFEDWGQHPHKDSSVETIVTYGEELLKNTHEGILATDEMKNASPTLTQNYKKLEDNTDEKHWNKPDQKAGSIKKMTEALKWQLRGKALLCQQQYLQILKKRLEMTPGSIKSQLESARDTWTAQGVTEIMVQARSTL